MAPHARPLAGAPDTAFAAIFWQGWVHRFWVDADLPHSRPRSAFGAPPHTELYAAMVLPQSRPASQPRPSAGARRVPVCATKVVRLEAGPKTNIPEVDEMAKTQFSCLCSIVQDICDLSDLVRPVFNFIQSEKKKLENRRAVGGGCAMLAEITTFQGLEENLKINFITKRSDLSGQDLITMMGDDTQHLQDLFQFALQLSMKQKFPSELLARDVMDDFLETRAKAAGDRLATFKEKGGLHTGTGRPRFLGATGCYDLKVEAGKVTRITHITGEAIDVEAAWGLTDKHSLRDNHDNWAASLVSMPDLRPLHIVRQQNPQRALELAKLPGQAQRLDRRG